MLHSLIATFFNKKPNRAEIFPLEAYAGAKTVAHVPQLRARAAHERPGATIEALRTQHNLGQVSAPRRLLTSIFTAIGFFVKFWVVFLAATDLSRRICFNNPHVSTLFPDAICDRISPSTHQFIDYFFSKDINDSKMMPSKNMASYVYRLQKYIQNPPKLVKRDFALRGAGASIISGLTSPSLHLPHSVFGSKTHDFNRPSIILEENVSVGDCWELQASNGWVAIRLSEEIYIDSMTIHYVDPGMLPPMMAAKAPHAVTLWALFDLKATRHISTATDVEWRSPKDFSVKPKVTEAVPFDHVFLPIVRANFSLDTWPMPEKQWFSAAAAHGSNAQVMRSDVVVIEVTSNWGAASTCLHHIGIHGRPSNA